ncbi:MAG TPA: hypothetical protein VE871_00015 [Longimicrobium sp.]|nr:hypothetical protein [Longimicrobium sp.]
MRKLKLDLDTLAVQSFSPAPVHMGRGTAHAHLGDTVLLPDDGAGTGGSGETNVDCLTCENSCAGRTC